MSKIKLFSVLLSFGFFSFIFVPSASADDSLPTVGDPVKVNGYDYREGAFDCDPRVGCKFFCECAIKTYRDGGLSYSYKYSNKEPVKILRESYQDAAMPGRRMVEVLLDVNDVEKGCDLVAVSSVAGGSPEERAERNELAVARDFEIKCQFKSTEPPPAEHTKYCCCTDAGCAYGGDTVRGDSKDYCAINNKGKLLIPPADSAVPCEQMKLTPDKDTSDTSNYNAANLLVSAKDRLNPLKFSSPINFIGRIMKSMTYNIGAIALLMYVWAGFLWMTAQGNAERTTKAKTILIWTTLGLVGILSSYILVNFVFQSILG